MEFVIHASKSISLMFLKFGNQKKNSSLNVNQLIERLCSRSYRRNSEHLHLQDAPRINPLLLKIVPLGLAWLQSKGGPTPAQSPANKNHLQPGLLSDWIVNGSH